MVTLQLVSGLYVPPITMGYNSLTEVNHQVDVMNLSSG